MPKSMLDLQTNGKEVTTLAAADLLLAMTDPAGTPDDAVISAASLYAAVHWIPVADTWTYASATTITVPTNATGTYQVGDKIRFKQGGSYKYMTMTTVAATLLTVFGGSDFSVANAAITDVSYSRAVRPYGFPEIFNFTPNWLAGVTVGNATIIGKVSVQGRTVKGNVSFKFPASSPTCAVTGQITLNPPIAVLSTLSGYTTVGAAACVDWASALYMGEVVMNGGAFELRAINVAGTYAVWTATASTVPFTWNVDDLFTMEFNYFI